MKYKLKEIIDKLDEKIDVFLQSELCSIMIILYFIILGVSLVYLILQMI